MERRPSSPLAGDDLYTTFTTLVRLQTRMWNELDARLRTQHAVPLADLTGLELVAGTDGARVQDLVETLHITVGGASKVVDRLVATGLAERAAHPHDRRSSLVTATDRGRAVLESARPDIDDVLSAYFVDADLHHLLTTLQALTPPNGTGAPA